MAKKKAANLPPKLTEASAISFIDLRDAQPSMSGIACHEKAGPNQANVLSPIGNERNRPVAVANGRRHTPEET
jgi:hypothetical protein